MPFISLSAYSGISAIEPGFSTQPIQALHFQLRLPESQTAWDACPLQVCIAGYLEFIQISNFAQTIFALGQNPNSQQRTLPSHENDPTA
jgi:hypothetical protein